MWPRRRMCLLSFALRFRPQDCRVTEALKRQRDRRHGRRLKVIWMVVAAATVSLACGHEPRNDELSSGDNVSPLGPNGEARMFVADQDSSFTRLCFEAPDLGLAPGTAVTVVHPAFPQFSTPGKLGKRTESPSFP